MRAAQSLFAAVDGEIEARDGEEHQKGRVEQDLYALSLCLGYRRSIRLRWILAARSAVSRAARTTLPCQRWLELAALRRLPLAYTADVYLRGWGRGDGGAGASGILVVSYRGLQIRHPLSSPYAPPSSSSGSARKRAQEKNGRVRFQKTRLSPRAHAARTSGIQHSSNHVRLFAVTTWALWHRGQTCLAEGGAEQHKS